MSHPAVFAGWSACPLSIERRKLFWIAAIKSSSFLPKLELILRNTFSINNELAKEHYSISYMEEATKDIIFKAIRRALNKTPIIIPIFAEIE